MASPTHSSHTGSKSDKDCPLTQVLADTVVVVLEGICAFLEPVDIVSFMKVPQLSGPLALGTRFCVTHGTYLDKDPGAVHPAAQPDNDNNLQALIWALQSQAFFATQTHPVLTSTQPDCEQCRMARFHGRELCQACHEYMPHEQLETCQSGVCQSPRACCDCHGMTFQCALCPDAKLHCEQCFHDPNLLDGQGFWCEACEKNYCFTCRPEVYCQNCYEGCCEECFPNSDMFRCPLCKDAFCFDCDGGRYCQACEDRFCETCRPGVSCDGCDAFFCDSHGRVSLCSTCDTFLCRECSGPSCEACDTFVCQNCKPTNFCVMCSSHFCSECMEGFEFGRGGHHWACLHCLWKHRDLMDMVKHEKNEKEGNICANCFLSEDDMDGVKLFACPGCTAVKYCSAACQSAHADEHAPDCTM